MYDMASFSNFKVYYLAVLAWSVKALDLHSVNYSPEQVVDQIQLKSGVLI